MNDNEQYDFYLIGRRRASDFSGDLKRQAKEIGEIYGEQARLEFESGLASIIPAYGSVSSYETSGIKKVQEGISSSEDLVIENAETDYGVENTRNNSYFGTKGTGVQVNSDGKFNEPRHR